MGNRAVITTAPFSFDNVGIYVHWNGGQESIEGFLAACREMGYCDPTRDPSYGLARLTQAIGLFFDAGDSSSVGIGTCGQLDCDNGDNGVWLIGKDWAIVGHGSPRGDGTWEAYPVAEAGTVDPKKSAKIKADILQLTNNAARKHLVRRGLA